MALLDLSDIPSPLDRFKKARRILLEHKTALETLDAATADVNTILARNVITSNVSLTAYTVAANQGVNDAVLNVEGDSVLLIGQTTAAQNGFYDVGAVSGGLAALTRSPLLPAGRVFDENSVRVEIAEGANNRSASFTNTAAGTVGTNDPIFRYRDGGNFIVHQFSVRFVIHGNVPDLTAYVVAADAARNDNTAGSASQGVLLIGQTTAAENGLYFIGTVSGGLAPLTRNPQLPAGLVLGSTAATHGVRTMVRVSSGDVFSNTMWFDTAASGSVIGATDPGYYPESVTQKVTLVNGAATIINVPILSASKTGVIPVRSTANTCAATDGGYVLNGDPTPGKLGTASVPIMASVLAGTINVADISTLHVTITNR